MGVNDAVARAFGSAGFGVPIRFGLDLLPAGAGRGFRETRPPESP